MFRLRWRKGETVDLSTDLGGGGDDDDNNDSNNNSNQQDSQNSMHCPFTSSEGGGEVDLPGASDSDEDPLLDDVRDVRQVKTAGLPPPAVLAAAAVHVDVVAVAPASVPPVATQQPSPMLQPRPSLSSVKADDGDALERTKRRLNQRSQSEKVLKSRPLFLESTPATAVPRTGEPLPSVSLSSHHDEVETSTSAGVDASPALASPVERSNRNGSQNSVKRHLDMLERSTSGTGLEFDSMFTIENKIGGGQFGSVYICRPVIKPLFRESNGFGALDCDPVESPSFESTGTDDSFSRCAVKVMKVSRRLGELKRLVNEVNVHRESISCENVVRFLGCFYRPDEGELLLVMELCALSLQDLVEHSLSCLGPNAHREDDGRVVKLFQESIAACILRGITSGVAFLHSKKIIHRDLKSANILLTSAGQVKLGDFGVSRQILADEVRLRSFVGSPYWLAPEAISRNEYWLEVDIWSIGIIALEMFEGMAPWQTIPPSKALLMIPNNPAPRLLQGERYGDGTRVFINNCLQKEPADRSTAANLLELPFLQTAEQYQPDVALEIALWEARGSSKPDASVASPTSTASYIPALILNDGLPYLQREVSSRATTVYSGVNRLLEIMGIRKRLYFGVPLEASWEACSLDGSEHMALSLIRFLRKSASDSDHILVRAATSNQRVDELQTLFDTGAGNSVDLTEWDPHDVAALLWRYFQSLPDEFASPHMFMRVPAGASENEMRAARDVLASLSTATVTLLHELLLLFDSVDGNKLLSNIDVSTLIRFCSSKLALDTREREGYVRWITFLHGSKLLDERLGLLQRKRSKSQS